MVWHVRPPVPRVGGEEELVVGGGDDQLGHQQLLPVLVAVDNVEHVLHRAQQFGHRCNKYIWRGGLPAQFLKTLLWNGVPISVVLCTLPICKSVFIIYRFLSVKAPVGAFDKEKVLLG